MYKLFWVEVNIKTESWFIIAKTKMSAEVFFTNYEGFGENMVYARLLCVINPVLIKKYDIKSSTFPPMELLIELDCKIYSYEVPRVVNYAGEIFIEGNLSTLIATDLINKKSGVYIIRNGLSNEFKIGITTNIRKRIQQFSTGNANTIQLIYFVQTMNYKSLEKHLHDGFKSERIKGEWFYFNEHNLETLKELFILLNTHDEYKVYDIEGLHKQLNYKTR